jgi:mRNA-degrading endonuclease toxin of MazEF toxin-antitoxin module
VADRSPLRYGRIIYAWISDRNGNAKLRPALVLTPDREIESDVEIVVVAITTTFTAPAPSFCVELPWHPAGRVGTKLTRRSAAVVNWLATISGDDVVGYGGDVPASVMNIIQQRQRDLPEN